MSSLRVTRALAAIKSFATVATLSALSVAAPAMLHAQTAGAFKVTNLLSDGSVAATTMDPNFINPWGISVSPTWWISAQGTGFNYVTAAAGTIAFKVIVPAAAGGTATGTPTGSVTTAGTTGMILPNGTKASFIFSSIDGAITGWNSKLGTANAISQVAATGATGSVYTGLAVFTNAAGASFLLAPNFGTGKVDIYDSTFKPATLAGTFTDPSLPTGYFPFSVHVIGTQVFVAYSQRTAAGLELVAPGNGVVSIFDLTGTFVARAVTGGNLNAPWGVAIAPASFGIFSKDLLVGNFGDGLINVYDPKTFAYLGQLIDGTGKPLAYASLWDLLPGGTAIPGGTTVSAGDPSTVFFTAGLAGEKHGLLAGIANDATTAGTPSFGVSTSSSALAVTAGSNVQATIAVAPTYNFSGTVTLACSGLPVGASCTFGPTQLTVAGTASSTGTVTILTSKANAALVRPASKLTTGLAFAMLLPFASLLAFRKRKATAGRSVLPNLLGVLLLLVSIGSLAGCNDSSSTPAVVTPAGQSTIAVTATSGTISQTTNVALTVQ
ncbi:TIGR03118 family protein [Granulicella tundricola]|uniref:TIGR03118 family protein n=1 Tax=Granulicella tundricola (strain ATCC BAA-1859 / DSM 23138 / MP5ACTX9) TaxID=1198114 RepID=E8WX46_GRATM|nr:TIGR03118 family protein [Granulicella tundricola]ADW69688.1 hypothetical protein AciX9_2664 [Granulicella tundricola MP5ACTX9]